MLKVVFVAYIVKIVFIGGWLFLIPEMMTVNVLLHIYMYMCVCVCVCVCVGWLRFMAN